MYLSNTLLSLSVALLATTSLAAYTCDSSVAITDEQLAQFLNSQQSGGSDSSSGSSGGSSGDLGVSYDPTCPYYGQPGSAALCQSLRQSALNSQLNAQLVAGGNSFLAAAGGAKVKRQSSGSLSCGDDQLCMSSVGVYLCLDLTSGDFTDSNGGSGNAASNMYTMANGVATSVADSATALPTPGSGSGSNAATATGTSSSGNGSGSSSSNSGSSGSGSSSTADNAATTMMRGVVSSAVVLGAFVVAALVM